jgi:transposase
MYDMRIMKLVWRHLTWADVSVRSGCAVAAWSAPSTGLARSGGGRGFTRDFEDLAAWLATKTDMPTVAAFARVALGDRGRDVRAGLDPGARPRPAGRANGYEVKEIFWRKHHNYLT